MERRTDVARVALQSVVASLLAYLVISWFQVGSLSWAIIASLFSIHASLDSTFGASFNRIAGAVVGAALGFALVYAFSGWEMMPVRIALIAALTNGLAVLRPKLDYAAAAGAVVALQPTPDMDGAAGTAIAVGIGGLCGTLASITIWPELSRHRAQRELGQALRLCQQIVDMTLNEVDHDVSDEKRQERAELQRKMLRHLEEAQTISNETRFRQYLASGARVSEFTRATERLWHSLIIVERVVTGGRDKFGAKDHAAIMPHVAKAHEVLCELLSELSEMVAHNTTEAPKQELWDQFKQAQRAAHEALTAQQAARDSVNERVIQTLLFGIDEIRLAMSEFQTLATKGKLTES